MIISENANASPSPPSVTPSLVTVSVTWIGRYLLGYMEEGIQTPMAQGRSTKIIYMITWIRTSRLSVKKSLSWVAVADGLESLGDTC